MFDRLSQTRIKPLAAVETRFQVHRLDLQQSTVSVQLRVESADESAVMQNRHRVVAELPFGFGHIDLHAIRKPEQFFGALSLPEQGIER